jgi:hypothetical protein
MRAVAEWSRPGDPAAADRGPAETSEYVVDGIARNTHRFLLPAGPRTIRALEIEPAAGLSDAWRAARLKLTWDGDDGAPGVDLPVAFAVGLGPGTAPSQSLLAGQTGSTWSNRFPMPYRQEAFLQIEAETAIHGTIRVRTVRGIVPDGAYFRATDREAASYPHAAIDRTGRGHLAGVLIATGRLPHPSTPPERSHERPGEIRWAIPDLGANLLVDRSPSRPAGWELAPAHGVFLGPPDSTPRLAAAYRWHAADPIPFAGPRRARSAPEPQSDPDSTEPGLAVALFWYSERPGPEPGRP